MKNGTRKTHSVSKHIDSKYACATFHGLNKWYAHLFEKLGWMILAKHNGMTDKTNMYLMSINHFKNEVEHKLKHMKDHDNKQDLHIMYTNICILLEHAKKDL